jgi:hypothetical protein
MARTLQAALVIGCQTDVLFPVWQQKEIADTLRSVGNTHVTYYELDALFGHDTFMIDVNSIGPAVKGHLEHGVGMTGAKGAGVDPHGYLSSQSVTTFPDNCVYEI